jgi:riboflavin transporter FmnP
MSEISRKKFTKIQISMKTLLADSARELLSVKTLIMLALMTAGAVVLGSHFRMVINEDLRVSFSFICIMAVAVLYGPVPCMLMNAVTDIVTYLLDKNEIRDYSPAILSVKLIVSCLYGVMLYKRHYGNFGYLKRMEEFFPECVAENLDIAVRSVCARTGAVLVGNVVLNSAVLYRLYHNSKFPIMSGGEWRNFFRWFKPRFETNLKMLPFELLIVFMFIPIINVIYTLVCRGFRQLCGGKTKN